MRDGTYNLESKLLEEPSVLAGLVLFFELGSHHVAGLLLLHGVLNEYELQKKMLSK